MRASAARLRLPDAALDPGGGDARACQGCFRPPAGPPAAWLGPGGSQGGAQRGGTAPPPSSSGRPASRG